MATTTLFTFGLSEIKFNGAKIGMTYKDSAKITQDQPDTTEHYEEGQPFPAISEDEQKVPKIEFSIMNPDAQFMQTYLGGKYDSATKTWSYGRTQGNIPSGLLDIITKKGMDFKAEKAKLTATIDFDLSAKGILLVKFVATPLLPDDITKEPFSGIEKATTP
ncbi:hypothetical protein BAY06_04050 [Elizabethkingia anophelis]|uniref:hypothetical protein n=1 Tax=Elizabethkingia anophelis TaxID=1117645 RepID=UPI00099B1E7F|nr:hypothetical protein [Elizabethkingia anophelis]OPC51509.1 hypothetical protein BAY06_04050 [Elizabethkingia anophelis]